jgi:hypothetical protein
MLSQRAVEAVQPCRKPACLLAPAAKYSLAHRFTFPDIMHDIIIVAVSEFIFVVTQEALVNTEKSGRRMVTGECSCVQVCPVLGR